MDVGDTTDAKSNCPMLMTYRICTFFVAIAFVCGIAPEAYAQSTPEKVVVSYPSKSITSFPILETAK